MPATATKNTCRALIVEDDAGARRSLETLLARQGHEVRAAATVGDALAALSWNPQCVILDLILPDGNGITVLRRIRRANMPARVAIVTGMQDPFAVDEVTDLEPDALFEKPLNLDALLRWIKRPARRKQSST
jgi:DNA-binding response OmpR family regulator